HGVRMHFHIILCKFFYQRSVHNIIRFDEGGFDYVISECQTCKWQIDMSSNVTCIHPLTLLCMSMDA
ncbi:hypothetical protein, partial [Haemophilus influenzae]|uniref:hypothetical protein n=1 Tax=Haemophilus influenzae TaxID=727 RepID=UPI001EDCAD70